MTQSIHSPTVYRTIPRSEIHPSNTSVSPFVFPKMASSMTSKKVCRGFFPMPHRPRNTLSNALFKVAMRFLSGGRDFPSLPKERSYKANPSGTCVLE
mmetsp:Transcript_10187/g.19960  ORF Transcript_10187/g.19960 Transcript_10187/m.19960 type:complete len:97 (-) Transcript_10187:1585-1875(-)